MPNPPGVNEACGYATGCATAGGTPCARACTSIYVITYVHMSVNDMNKLKTTINTWNIDAGGFKRSLMHMILC